jgi:hypothetical protein
MPVEERLDFTPIGFLASTDHRVLDAPDDSEAAVFVYGCEDTRVHPAESH